MTPQQAKQSLLTYRPWLDEAPSPEVAEALALCCSDRELAAWFEQHCALQHKIRAGFKQIAIPEGLKEQIVSEHRAQQNAAWWRNPRLLATAAVVAILISFASLLWRLPRSQPEDLSLAGFRSRVVKTALRAYDMDLETNDVTQVRAYLAQQSTHPDYVLPTKLQKTETVGCAALTWQGKSVAMVCFRTGKPLAPGQKSDLWLFVIDRKNLPDAAGPAPEFAAVSKLSTATWASGEKLYVLAGYDATEVRSRL